MVFVVNKKIRYEVNHIGLACVSLYYYKYSEFMRVVQLDISTL
ncbi:hypothetical protein KL86DYS1_10457 [uncultured Dysgonomonas sp.]|uniref:Uncharacterized protein n=1 Tax=uncultured Dysgonomonas sp. TaxID=206096 RepID=A0A212IXG8_9BACT|nr:hypothetical protein KL86DYS1_10457 [uncultured Dysgonomonas sp.]